MTAPDTQVLVGREGPPHRGRVQPDGRTLYLVAVDGRQAHSRGLTRREMAELLHNFGADTAVNLDGGGSSTLVARTPGSAPQVDNHPSDGQERGWPTGLAFSQRPVRAIGRAWFCRRAMVQSPRPCGYFRVTYGN